MSLRGTVPSKALSHLNIFPLSPSPAVYISSLSYRTSAPSLHSIHLPSITGKTKPGAQASILLTPCIIIGHFNMPSSGPSASHVIPYPGIPFPRHSWVGQQHSTVLSHICLCPSFCPSAQVPDFCTSLSLSPLPFHPFSFSLSFLSFSLYFSSSSPHTSSSCFSPLLSPIHPPFFSSLTASWIK